MVMVVVVVMVRALALCGIYYHGAAVDAVLDSSVFVVCKHDFSYVY